MRLKTYQQNTLNVLKRFFECCRVMGAETAYRKITSEPEIAARLGALRGGYVMWDAIPHTPRVCLKVPTGGGKTIMAAHAVKIVGDTWCETEKPVVLWFCPSDTIRRQTGEALKNPRHPYRLALDGLFGGGVKVFDIDEKFNIRPSDIENNVCIIVSTIQAFRQSATEKYNVYRHNEELEPHFSRIQAAGGMERSDRGKLKFSFANLLFHHRPIAIVDEAHNVISGLSQEMQARINPSAIVELTATPRGKNNTLYNVRAMELKEEEMIKLPIELREHRGWEHAVDEAMLKRAELESEAKNDMDYIRPILLFQAQDKGGEVTVDVLKDYLVGTANIPASEIAIATGDQKELDGVNVLAHDCPVKYIITIQALKEGWDCSFAYVLCSLVNIKSDTAVEQLLGRVMRMPNAETRKAPALNKAYAYVLSPTFGEAAGALVKKLGEKGFDETEAQSAIEQKPTELAGQFVLSAAYKVDLDEPLLAAESRVTYAVENGGKTIVLTEQTTEADIEALALQVPLDKSNEIRRVFSTLKRIESEPSPAKRGERFSVPRMMVELKGEWLFPDPERIFEEFDWNILRSLKPQLAEDEFTIRPEGHSFIIELDGNRLAHSLTPTPLPLPAADVESWTAANLVLWLGGRLRQADTPKPTLDEWLRQAIEHLTDVRKMKLSHLTYAKYALVNKIEAKIINARSNAREQAFQAALFGQEANVRLDFDNGFEFSASMYDDTPLYNGSYRFRKHYLGALKVPLIDGGEKGEEFGCAKTIDRIEQVEYWLRNVSRHPRSFYLDTSTGRFFPDFVARLKDGRVLLVEYKGEHIKDSQETKQKKMVGELWERRSNGKCLFLMAFKEADGLGIYEQVMKKIGFH